MSIKQKIQNLVSPLYNKVWHGPKGKIRERLKKVCDDMPHKQRLTVVTVLLTAFHPDSLLRIRSRLLQDGSRTRAADY